MDRTRIEHLQQDLPSATADRADYLRRAIDLCTRRRSRLVLQTEAAECGIACLAMVASWHGHAIDLASLRKRFAVSQRGMTLRQLMNVGQKLGLTTRAVRLDLADAADLTVPCVLHWDMQHFVVLRKVGPRRFQIDDPARGSLSLSHAEVSRHFTGVALEMFPSSQFERVVEHERLGVGRLLGRIRGLVPSVAQILLLSVLLELLSLIGPFFTQWIVDGVIVSGDGTLLNTLAVGFGLVYLSQVVLSLARSWMVLYFSTHLSLQWTSNIFSHLLRLPVSWFERRHLGDVTSRFSSVSAIQQFLTTSFAETVIDGLLAVTTLAMMLVYNVKLSLIVFASLGVYALLRWISYVFLQRATRESLVLSARQNSIFLESVLAIQTIKLFSSENDRRSRWLNATVEAMNRTLTTTKIGAWFAGANSLLTAGETLLVMWLGAGMVLAGGFTVGMLFAFIAYKNNFTIRVFSLIDRLVSFKMLGVQADRLADIVLAEPERTGAEIGVPDHAAAAEIRFEKVSFRYGEDEEPVLKDIDLVVHPGEFVAIVGPSGCGKSTLSKILLGLVEPTGGAVYYGSHPVAGMHLGEYRDLFGAVMQDDALLAGSIADNISFFAEDPDPARIQACARLAAIDREIEAMPMGYQSLVGDMGTALSGGQKQRLLIARAVYKNPKVLLFDEATSHLDIATERVVAANLKSLSITRVVIAHRPQAIQDADRVVDLGALPAAST